MKLWERIFKENSNTYKSITLKYGYGAINGDPLPSEQLETFFPWLKDGKFKNAEIDCIVDRGLHILRWKNGIWEDGEFGSKKN